MIGNADHSLNAGGVALSTPFCRVQELADILEQLQRPDCSAIFLSGETGMGITSLLRELTEVVSSRTAVIGLQGTPSLTSIPFGILAPFVRRNSSAFIESHVDAIRKTLELLAELEADLPAGVASDADVYKPLIIIDEADYIDKSTAEVMVSLAQAEKIKLVVAHRASNEPVSPLPQLWEAGVAERIQLKPLTRDSGHDFCLGVLGGPPKVNASWYFWSTAGGNPLLMRLVIEDALASGKLQLKDGVWVMDIQSVPAGHHLQSVVREQLRGLSQKARNTLSLVALSEPISAEIVTGQMGASALAELRDRRLLLETVEGTTLLRLMNPVYGEVIREMVPHAQRRMLHSRLIDVLKKEPATPESLLRMAIWTLESGLPVPDEELLTAAIFACKLYESRVALRLADEVSEARNRKRADVVKARARFNMGEYETAAKLLQQAPAEAASVAELMFGGLLRAANQSALGLPAETIQEAAVALRLHGERLAQQDLERSAEILLRTQERAHIIDLLAHSRSGNYAAMSSHIESVLSRTDGNDDVDHLCNRSIALALDAERLSALGFPVAGMAQAATAFSIVQTEDHDVFFVPEMIISRAQVASLTAGQWQEAEQILQFLAVDVGKATISFGGSVGVARGMMLLRQGRTTAALEVLLSGMDSLQHNDPQQLLGYCASMAAYCAAKAGQFDLAGELVKEYSEDTSMFVVVAHERAFIAAAREYLEKDGKGNAELLRIAEEASAHGLLTVELNALSLLLEFEPAQARRRILAMANNVEGSWAAGLHSYATALEQRQTSVMVAAAEQLLEAQMYQHANRVLRVASSAAGRDRDGRLSRLIQEGLNTVEEAFAAEHNNGGRNSGSHQGAMRAKLTARELEIALMAAQGMTDKSIAAQLHVSVRTVEGHLYRTYSKLEITDRSDLGVVLSD